MKKQGPRCLASNDKQLGNTAQRFLSVHDQINTIFRTRRYKLSASSYRHARADAFSLWSDYTAEMNA
ncbi:hypothetical protein OA90_27555 [Labrenzia sp. OB1]|nr:hypothetical protein OA90_27555 [Labrenzia sp. OB1]